MMGGISRLSRSNVGDDQIERHSVLRRHIEEFKNQRSFLVFPRLYSHNFVTTSISPTCQIRSRPTSTLGNIFSRWSGRQSRSADAVGRRRLHGPQCRDSDAQRLWAGVAATYNEQKFILEGGEIVENWPQVNFERLLM